jgi:hypothetical protein
VASNLELRLRLATGYFGCDFLYTRLCSKQLEHQKVQKSEKCTRICLELSFRKEKHRRTPGILSRGDFKERLDVLDFFRLNSVTQ